MGAWPYPTPTYRPGQENIWLGWISKPSLHALFLSFFPLLCAMPSVLFVLSSFFLCLGPICHHSAVIPRPWILVLTHIPTPRQYSGCPSLRLVTAHDHSDKATCLPFSFLLDPVTRVHMPPEGKNTYTVTSSLFFSSWFLPRVIVGPEKKNNGGLLGP